MSISVAIRSGRATPEAWRCCVQLAVAIGLGRFFYTPVLPYMTSAGVMTTSNAGYVASSNLFGYVLGALASARICRRFGPARLIRVGGLAVALLTMAMALTRTVVVWALLRFATGVASAAVFVAVAAIVFSVDSQSTNRTTAARAYSGVGLGVIVTAAIVGVCQVVGFGWESMWVTAGMIGLLAMMASLPDGHQPATTTEESVRTKLPVRQLVPLASTYAAAGFGYIITATYVTVIVRRANLGQAVETGTWLLFGLTSLFSPGLWSAARQRAGTIAGLTAALIIQAIGVGALLWRQTIITSWVAAACLGGTVMGITAMALAEARQIAGRNTAGVMSMLTTSYGVGQALGPLAAGALAGINDDLRQGSTLAIAVLLAGCIVLQSSRQPNGR